MCDKKCFSSLTAFRQAEKPFIRKFPAISIPGNCISPENGEKPCLLLSPEVFRPKSRNGKNARIISLLRIHTPSLLSLSCLSLSLPLSICYICLSFSLVCPTIFLSLCYVCLSSIFSLFVYIKLSYISEKECWCKIRNQKSYPNLFDPLSKISFLNASS